MTRQPNKLQDKQSLSHLLACAVMLAMGLVGGIALPSAVVAGEVCDGAGGAKFYGPIAHGETLWEIARDLRDDDSVSIVRMAAAIKRVNGAAFGSGNVRKMKVCKYLRLPNRSQLGRVSEQQARSEIFDG